MEPVGNGLARRFTCRLRSSSLLRCARNDGAGWTCWPFTPDRCAGAKVKLWTSGWRGRATQPVCTRAAPRLGFVAEVRFNLVAAPPRPACGVSAGVRGGTGAKLVEVEPLGRAHPPCVVKCMLAAYTCQRHLLPQAGKGRAARFPDVVARLSPRRPSKRITTIRSVDGRTPF